MSRPVPLDRATVLVVEDEQLALEMLEQYLELVVERVETARDGLQGLCAFERHRPHAVITDLNMPVMDGYEMCERIHQLDPSVPILVLSAFVDARGVGERLEHSFTEIFSKPVRPRVLLSALRRALEGGGE